MTCILRIKFSCWTQHPRERVEYPFGKSWNLWRKMVCKKKKSTIKVTRCIKLPHFSPACFSLRESFSQAEAELCSFPQTVWWYLNQILPPPSKKATSIKSFRQLTEIVSIFSLFTLCVADFYSFFALLWYFKGCCSIITKSSIVILNFAQLPLFFICNSCDIS